ncbi:MAG TPA: lactate utilization protein [Candidatus Limiplasma sp.]|nr:lactate utilization protein [Candidatus Limiplasma sp.]HPS81127.1 lactate utilization protein [Candidatus Limiplasma sp.]
MDQKMQAALEGMRKHGFTVVEMETAAQAKAYLLDAIPAGSNIGVGGSVSLRDIDVLPALSAKGCNVYTTWGADKADVPAIRENSRKADVYLSSANAVTKNGSLVFIDGTCNRVGAILDGPKTVYFVISHSKWVDGGINTAVARIKQTACPQNARRIGLDTPCAKTGLCKPDECGESCMCSATVSLDRVPRGRKMTVLFVEEALGY